MRRSKSLVLAVALQGLITASALASNAPTNSWSSTEGTLWSLATDPQGQWIAAGSATGFIQVFEQTTFMPQHRLKAWGKAVFSLAFSPNGKALAACDYSGQMRIFDTQSWQVTHQIQVGQGCEQLALSDTQVALAGTPGPDKHALWLYDLKTRKLSAPLHSAPAAQRYFAALDFHPDQKHLAVGSANRQHGVEIFTVQAGQLKSLKKWATAGDVMALNFSPNGKYLAASSQADVQLWAWQTGQRFWSQAFRKGKDTFVKGVQFSPNSQQIAACGTGRGNPVQVYRTGNGQPQTSYGEVRAMNCNAVRYDQAGKHLMTVRQVYSNFNEQVIDRYPVP